MGKAQSKGEIKRYRMRVIYAFWLAFLLGAVSRNQAVHPSIKFTETEFDFGELNQNVSVTHVFKFYNVGNDTLVINKVKAP